MSDTNEEEDERLLPYWKVNEKLTYKIWKEETFRFKDRESPPFERDYTIELTLMDDGVVEAYYPASLLSAIKLLNDAHPYFSQINHVRNNTLYYQIDENYKFVELLNLDQLLDNLSAIKEQLKQIVPPEEQEDIIDNLEVVQSTSDLANKYFAKDIEVIHDFYGTTIYDGYYFDLANNKSTAKVIKEKLLGLIKMNLGKIDVLQAEFINEDYYMIELLKGHDTISTLTRQDFEKIQTQFLNHEFDIRQYDDVTLHYQKFLYSSQDFIMRQYEYYFMIDTPKMRKLMRSQIELVE